MSSSTPTIEPREAAERLASGELALIDVREDDEWQAGRIPGARHIPLGELAERFHEVVDAGPRVAFVCRSGGRSGYATEAARAAGLSASNLAGGMQAWAAADLPMVPDDGWVA